MVKEDSASPSAIKPTVFLLYGPLHTGGTETLIVRIANYYAEIGANVFLILSEDGPLRALIKNSVHFRKYESTKVLIEVTHSIAQEIPFGSEILIITFDPISAARGLAVENSIRHHNAVNHVSWVLHPHAFFMHGERKDRKLLNHLVANAVGFDKLLFMNEESRSSHSAQWKRDLSGSPIIGLPITYQEKMWRARPIESMKIVSVGRLVDFKAYNLGTIKIIQRLRALGIKATWDIYGYGPLEDPMRDEINQRGVRDSVRLCGELDYTKYAEVVPTYDIFVGMGTAALEAAMLGVPTICATVDEPENCHGYIHEIPFGNVGEKIPERSMFPIVELLRQFHSTPEPQRELISASCKEAAQRYSIDELSKILDSKQSRSTTKESRFMKRIVTLIYFFATESLLAGLARRLFGKTHKKSPVANSL